MAQNRRSFHTASYINDKIYFLGGEVGKGLTNDFFYLDVSKPFKIPGPPMSDLISNSIPNHESATSSVCGPNKDEIFLFGETNININLTTPLVFAFNIHNSQKWTPVDNRGQIGRKWSASACDENAMYIFGGSSKDNVFRNDFNILNTSDLAFISQIGSNVPPPMDVATATLLPDGRIVYIGGNNNNGYLNMYQVYLYDTTNNSWLQMNTNGPPSLTPRGLHTAVLTKDGRIIVYGGVTGSGGHHYAVTTDPLLVLDTTVNSFTWSIPDIVNPPSAPSIGHTATLVGNYMIVAFGSIYQGDSIIDNSNQILMLDISDKNHYEWVNDFAPSPPSPPLFTPPPSPSPRGSGGNSNGVIIGICVGIPVAIVLIVIISILIYKKNKTEYERPPQVPQIR